LDLGNKIKNLQVLTLAGLIGDAPINTTPECIYIIASPKNKSNIFLGD
jgi:hypothetical protein